METWKDIPGYEGLYQVSDFGNVKSLRGKEKILKPSSNGKGYLTLILSKNNKRYYPYVHRLVGELFVENPDNKPEINHKDGNKANNHKDNLEWCTHLENIKHSCRTGLKVSKGAVGERNCKAKLTEEIVVKIREMYSSDKISQKELSIIFNISRTTISSITLNKTWKKVKN